MSYVCQRCGVVTDSPNIEIDREAYGGRFYEETFLGSCNCGGEYKAAKECPICGAYHEGEYDVCDKCMSERMTYKNVKKYSDDRKFGNLDVMVPNMVYHILGVEIIEDVLIDHLIKNFDCYKDKVKEYLNEDMYDFEEWIKGEKKC